MNEVVVRAIQKILTYGKQGEWKREWQGISQAPRNPFSEKEPYHRYVGSNAVALTFATIFGGYTCPYWAGLDQINQAEGRLKKGTQMVPVLVPIIREVLNEETGETEERVVSFRVYHVANLQSTTLDINTLVHRELEMAGIELSPFQPLRAAEEVIGRWKATPIEYLATVSTPHYNIPERVVYLPEAAQFNNADAYYSTTFHELAHAAGHILEPEMLRDGANRPLEEVVAELTAMTLCMEVGIAGDALFNSAHYVKEWGTAAGEWDFLQAMRKAARRAEFILKGGQKDNEAGQPTQAAHA